MATGEITRLPEELLLAIFDQLEGPAPSEIKARLEPNLTLTSGTDLTYKSISRVCKRWRRIISPLLFRYSRLQLDVAPRPEWRDRGSFDASTSQDALDGAVGAVEVAEYAKIHPPTYNGRSLGEASLQWAQRFHHTLEDCLAFVATNNLSSSIQSFILLTDRMLPGFNDRYPHRLAATQDHRYRAAALLWQRLYSAIRPQTVKVLAPPPELAILTNCAIDLFGEWAFSDMDFHLLTISVDDPNALHPSLDSSELNYIPPQYPSIAPSSILKLQPWTHLSLNEGSFLKAYGTYEYFERGPPSLIYSIKPVINPKPSTQLRHGHPPGSIDLQSLKSFTYTAILPFATHLDFRTLIPHLDELDIKLAPDPSEQENLLGDKERVGHAELEDCWQEFFTAYRFITRPFRTFDMNGTLKLKKFVCRDVKICALQEELDEEFTPLCLPCWAEMEPGVFVRQMEVPDRYFEGDVE
ncbi:hypothetical protein HII31_13572 [Pseudocercospora fuligena]|uniref:F-box domain-containing protein n=1 Tax=Pseudocercospora fuligena TaxID=685502 RepID=A0A8H6VE87_9PEZI|nr:hypothetical protein HII31_13572 [Pseudocercospora fuligena]